MTPAASGSHVAGGPCPQGDSHCPNCERPLTTLWNIDLNDPKLPSELRDIFPNCDRLPFLICWQCVSSSYWPQRNGDVKCFPFDWAVDYLEEDETPFAEASNELPERTIAFDVIPANVETLLDDEDNFESFDEHSRTTLEKWYGKELRSSWSLPFSQLGGQPLIVQRHTNLACPNSECPAHSLLDDESTEDEYFMQELAVVHHDHEPVLAQHCFQILYYVCGICGAIRGEYRCG